MIRLIDGDDVNGRTQSAGATEEEDVTICQGTSEEGCEEGVGEWKAGIADRAGQGCWWLWLRKSVALTVSDVLLVLSSLSLYFSARPSRYYFCNRGSPRLYTLSLNPASLAEFFHLNPNPCQIDTTKVAMPRRAAALATPATTSTPLTDGTLIPQSDDPFASQVSLLRRQWKWAVFSQFFYTFATLFAMPDVSLTVRHLFSSLPNRVPSRHLSLSARVISPPQHILTLF